MKQTQNKHPLQVIFSISLIIPSYNSLQRLQQQENMFQNTPQITDFIDVFDAKVTKEKSKVSYKTVGANGVARVFDSKLKGYIIQVQGGATNRLIIPKQDHQSLFLVQQYLILMVQPQQNFSVQLYFSDTNKTKRRIIISQNCQKPESKLFFVRIPSGKFCSKWSYICIDLWSFMTSFHGHTYRALEQIYLGGSFKLKRILTSKYTIGDFDDTNSVSLPKQFQFPCQIQYIFKSYFYSQFFSQIQTIVSDAQNTTLQKSVVRQKSYRKDKFTTPMNNDSDRMSASKNRIFANNSQSLNNKRIQLPLISKISNRSTTIIKASSGNDKKITSKPPLVRRITGSSQKNPSSIIGGSTLMSIQMKRIPKIQKSLDKVVVNQWRSNIAKVQPETTSFQTSSFINKSTNTTLFNKRNHNKLNPLTQQPYMPEKSIYSDSQYFEMSQKFSTITDQKFFKRTNDNKWKSRQKQAEKGEQSIDQQIEQSIQVQINSNIDDCLNKKQQQLSKIQEEVKYETIQKKQEQLQDSRGFARLHYKDFLTKAERPYSPPYIAHEIKTQQCQISVALPKTEIQVIYDPILKCYYDFKTQTYYELKV